MNDFLIDDWTPDKYMLEVTLNEPDDFLKVRETLSRIGIASKREINTLYQSCHILHKQGRYFIAHFKEMFLLDGKDGNLCQEDLRRRNTIATLLQDWGLVRIVKIGAFEKTCSMRSIKIISHAEKSNWSLIPKYEIGRVKQAN